MTEWQKKAAEIKANLKIHLDDMKKNDPAEYQKLVDAENTMYQSWLDHGRFI